MTFLMNSTLSCTITQGDIPSTICPPPSKSHTHRALLFALLAKGPSKIFRPLFSFDTDHMVKAIEALGATVKIYPDHYAVEGCNGSFSLPNKPIDAGNSGIVFRFIAALASHLSKPVFFTGDHSILYQRPILPLFDALNSLGVHTSSSPFSVCGPLNGGNAIIKGPDSQPLSALLIASSFTQKSTTITFIDPKERPWIDLTLCWMKKMHMPYLEDPDHTFFIPGGLHALEPFHATIPSDWSSAAFPIALALLSKSEMRVTHLDWDDPQGDKKIVEILEKMGACFVREKDSLYIPPNQTLYGGTIDVDPLIDALPILMAIAPFTKKGISLYNIEGAKIKESNRVEAMSIELSKMGVSVALSQNSLFIAPQKLHLAHLDSHHDHRIAMALAVASKAAGLPCSIQNVRCVSKTYPTFWKDLIPAIFF